MNCIWPPYLFVISTPPQCEPLRLPSRQLPSSSCRELNPFDVSMPCSLWVRVTQFVTRKPSVERSENRIFDLYFVALMCIVLHREDSVPPLPAKGNWIYLKYRQAKIKTDSPTGKGTGIMRQFQFLPHWSSFCILSESLFYSVECAEP